MEGYIQLHRQIIDSAVFANPNHLKIWLWILIKAHHKEKEIPIKIGGGNSTLTVKRGEFIFGRNTSSDELCMSGSMIYRALQKFEKLKMITIKSNNQYSIISICNYDTYQSTINTERTTAEPDVNQTRTRREPDVNTNNNVNNDNNVNNIIRDPHFKKNDVQYLDEQSNPNELILQYLSTSTITQQQKELFILNLERNSYLKYNKNRIKLTEIRAEAEFLAKSGFLKTNTETTKENPQYKTIGGYWNE
jgi:hypothetical protein